MATNISKFMGGAIKSIQRGAILTTGQAGTGYGIGTATLSPSVDTSKSILTFLGDSSDGTSGANIVAQGRVALTSGSQVTAYSNGYGVSLYCGFQVVEYY